MVEVIAELGCTAKRQEEATEGLNKELRKLEQQLGQGSPKLAMMSAPFGDNIGGVVPPISALSGAVRS